MQIIQIFLSITFTTLKQRKRWREKAMSMMKLRLSTNPLFHLLNNWALYSRPPENPLSRSARYFAMDMKCYLELHGCMWGCCWWMLSSMEPRGTEVMGNLQSNLRRAAGSPMVSQKCLQKKDLLQLNKSNLHETNL